MKNYFKNPLPLRDLLDHSNPNVDRKNLEDDLIHGCQSLSHQIRIQRSGGHSVKVRQLTESDYDEDDSTVVDPSIDRLDKFERAQAITDQISYRMRKSKQRELDQLDV